MVNERFLVTRPNHDNTVTYLHNWSKEILSFADKKNIKYSDFEGKKANKADVTRFLLKQDPRLVLLNGHGTSTTICGHKDEDLITIKNNELLKDKIVYALACDSASTLGINAVKDKECKAFIGYEEAFGFVKDASKDCIPSRDKFAEPFKNFSNEISLELLRGKSVGEAMEKSQKMASNLLKFYSASDALPEYKDIRFWLFWDKYFQRALGDQSARFLDEI